MNLRLILFLILSTPLVMSACSVYRSSGRKSFESNSSGNINTSANVGFRSPDMETTSEDLHETCWSQLASEPLWQVNDTSPLIVTKLNDDEIQVCLQSP